MSTFELLAAIDLRGGHVVRLRQGDFERETAYGDDAVAMALSFVGQGARWLHVVDLDGARAGEPRQGTIVAAIAAAAGPGVAVEHAGGLRTVGAVDAALAAGATRIVLGTAALTDPRFTGELVRRHGSARVAAAVDVRDGRAVGSGWQAGAAGVPPDEAIRRLADVGVDTFEVTAIDRDGLLEGPDLALLEGLAGLGRGRIIASAGLASLDDLRAVLGVGCAGAIVGRALYERRIDLAEAIAALR